MGFLIAFATKTAIDMLIAGSYSAVTVLCGSKIVKGRKWLILINQEDIKSLNENQGINLLIKRYLTEYLNFVFEVNQIDTLEGSGFVNFLENKREIENIKYILTNESEFTEIIKISNHVKEIELLHGCFVLSADFAVSVFVERGVLNTELEEQLLKNAERKEIVYVWKRKIFNCWCE